MEIATRFPQRCFGEEKRFEEALEPVKSELFFDARAAVRGSAQSLRSVRVRGHHRLRKVPRRSLSSDRIARSLPRLTEGGASRCGSERRVRDQGRDRGLFAESRTGREARSRTRSERRAQKRRPRQPSGRGREGRYRVLTYPTSASAPAFPRLNCLIPQVLSWDDVVCGQVKRLIRE